MKLFEDAEERRQALMACAGVAAHAIVSNVCATDATTLRDPQKRQAIVGQAFDLAQDFLAEAERRVAAI